VVGALLPIEPFKLFYKIDTRVNALGYSLWENIQSLGQSSRPAGLSQMGYACFWPACDSAGPKGEEGSGSHLTGRESAEIIHVEAGTAGKDVSIESKDVSNESSKESSNESSESSNERFLAQ